MCAYTVHICTVYLCTVFPVSIHVYHVYNDNDDVLSPRILHNTYASLILTKAPSAAN